MGLPAFPTAFGSRTLGLIGACLVGHLNDVNALAAMGLSNTVCNITGFSCLSGLASAISTISSQAWGAQAYRTVGLELQRGALILLCLCDLPLAIIWLSAEPLLVATGQSPDVAELVGLYARIRLPGLLFETLSQVMIRTLSATGNTWIPFLGTIVSACANVAGSVLLIPHVGFVGAPIMATASDFVQLIVVCILAWRQPEFRRCWHGFTWEAWTNWGPFLKLAFPSCALQCVEWWSWDVLSFISGLISELAQATQAVAPGIADLQYSVGQAMSTASTTVIGNLLGENRPWEARRSAVLSTCVLICFTVVQAMLFVALRSKLPMLFTSHSDVIQSIFEILPLCLAFSFFDSNQAGLSGILSGAGKQGIAAPLIFVCYWLIGVPLGCMLAFGAFGMQAQGLAGIWIGMLVAVLCHNVSFVVLIWRLDWVQIAARVSSQMHAAEDLSNLGAGLVRTA